MPDRKRIAREPFRLSLGGLTSVAGFVAPPIIADDRIRQEIDPSRDDDAGAAAAPRPGTAAGSEPRRRRRAA